MLNNLRKSEKNDKDPQVSVKKNLSVSPQQSLFSRLIESLKNTFAPLTASSPPASPPPALKGRVNSNNQASKILDHFLVVAQKLEKNILDEDLANHVQTAMESIKRDFHRIQKKIAGSPDEQSDKVYHSWMKRAKGWIDLDSNFHDRAAVINVIIKQQFSALDELIEHDLQLIFDYETHILADLPISPNEKNKLEQVILAHLTPHTQALIKLREHPPKLELHKVAQWKKNIDHTRSLLFEKALHAIDVVIATLSPVAPQNKEPDKVLEAIASEIDLLQKKTSAALDIISEGILDQEIEKKDLETTLLLLQQQAHQLSGNLHLTHDLYEQLQSIQQDLEKIEALI